MFRPTSILCLASLAILPSCSLFNGEEDYDTSDPYGVPNGGGSEIAPYQEVNPPANSNPTYGSAAYEETTSTPAYTAPSAPSVSSHTVSRGDTLWSLSKKYGVDVKALQAANGMATGDTNIRIGQTLSIPAN